MCTLNRFSTEENPMTQMLAETATQGKAASTTREGTTMTEELIRGTGGLLFVRTWRPAGKARGVVAIIPGFNSHSGHYLWVAGQLAASGLAVYAVDLRGRGKSDGERFYIDSMSEYQSDVAALMKLARSREPGLPVFILGHSAGGVIASVYTLDNQAQLAGLICESFAFKVPPPNFVLAIIKGLSYIAPRFRVLRLKNAQFSRDPKVVQALNTDPLIANEVQPTKTVAELVRGTERLRREFPLITLPVLIMHGTLDATTVPSGSQFFYDTAGSADKKLTLYKGHFHDLLNDTGKEKVMADITTWIGERLARPNRQR